MAHLLDDGSFRELGTLVGGDIAADGIVAGSGTIDGAPVMVNAEDFTTVAGTIQLRAATPSATASPSWRYGTRSRW